MEKKNWELNSKLLVRKKNLCSRNILHRKLKPSSNIVFVLITHVYIYQKSRVAVLLLDQVPWMKTLHALHLSSVRSYTLSSIPQSGSTFKHSMVANSVVIMGVLHTAEPESYVLLKKELEIPGVLDTITILERVRDHSFFSQLISWSDLCMCCLCSSVFLMLTQMLWLQLVFTAGMTVCLFVAHLCITES